MTRINAEWFQSQRPRLFALAYRMLGSASDADDVLQDAWVRLTGATPGDIESPQAFATTVVSRLCLDRLKSARAQRETYVGPWLPEPVLTPQQSPDAVAERAESVTMAFLVLLETLSAEERAVFLLKEIFDYEHTEIAAMLGLSAANSRQLLHRAKAKVRDLRSVGQGVVTSRRSVAEQFAQALQSGDTTMLTSIIAADCSFIADGGGKVAAARRPLQGHDEVLKLLLGLHRTAKATGLASIATLHVADVNMEPAVIIRSNGRIDTVFVLSISKDTITDIRAVRNPEKLAYLEQQFAISTPVS